MNGHTPPPAAGDQGSSPASLILVRAEQTCHAYPSQWNAWDTTGAYWYLRAEWGNGSYGRDTCNPAHRFTYDDQGGPVTLTRFIASAGLRWAPELARSVTAFEHAEGSQMSTRRISEEAVAVALEMAGEWPADQKQSGWMLTPGKDGVLVTYKAAGTGEAVMRRETFRRWTTALQDSGWTVTEVGTGTGLRDRILHLLVMP